MHLLIHITSRTQSKVNPVQSAIDMVHDTMQKITQSMASVRLAYEEAHGPGSVKDLTAMGDAAPKQLIDMRLIQNMLRLVQGELSIAYDTSTVRVYSTYTRTSRSTTFNRFD